MKAKLLSLGCGIATEALLFLLMIVGGGGIGPCGPAGFGVAGFVLLVHIPVIWLAVGLGRLGVSDDYSAVLLGLAPVLYVMLWSFLRYLFWKRKFVRRDGADVV